MAAPRSSGQTGKSGQQSRSKSKGKSSSSQSVTFMDLLKEDHEKVKDLFEEFENTEDSEEQEDLFAQIRQELEAHLEAEESYFYPALEESEESRDMALESYEEHHVAKSVLSELSDMDQEDERWKAKMKVLKEIVEMHIQEEEGQIFKIAKKALDREQIQEITQSISEQKNRMHAQA